MPLEPCAIRNRPPAPLPPMMRTGAPLLAATMMLVNGMCTICITPPVSAVSASPGLGMNFMSTFSPSSLNRPVACA